MTLRKVMRASLLLDVAVVRAPSPRRCQECGKRRVVFGFGVTIEPIGNPPTEWKCAPCWGLR